jgi:hypothetical protein
MTSLVNSNRSKKKTKIHSKLFKKASSSKQSEQQCTHSDDQSTNEASSDARYTKRSSKSENRVLPPADNGNSPWFSKAYPVATAGSKTRIRFCPYGDTAAPHHRCSSASSLQSPYMSKTSEKSLSPMLKKCQRNRSDTKQHCIDNKSAWEQRQPASMSTGRSRSGLSKSEGRIRSGLSKSEGRIKSGLSKSMGRSRSGLSIGRSRGSGISLGRSMGSGLSITVEEPHFTTETRDAYYTGMADIIETPSSSESLSLPVEVSPAYKFVPIGYEEDADYYKSFDSQDYDICKEFNDDEIDQEAKAPSVKIVVGSSSAKNVVPPSLGSDASTDDKYAPSSSSGHK